MIIMKWQINHPNYYKIDLDIKRNKINIVKPNNKLRK